MLSFSAEIRDFINGAKAGAAIRGAKTDRAYKEAMTKYTQARADQLADPEYLQLQKDILKGRADFYKHYQNDPMKAMRAQALQLQMDYDKWKWNTEKQLLAKHQNGDTNMQNGAAGYATGEKPMYTPAPAQPAWPTNQQPAQAIPMFPVGGYAGGGVVTPDDFPAQDANQSQTDADIKLAQQQLQQDYATQAPQFSYQAAHDAVRDGLIYGMNKAKQDHAQQAPTAAIDFSARSRFPAPTYPKYSPQDATPQDIEAITNKIDPKHQLSDGQRNMAAIGAVYQWKMAHGDPLGARKAAFQMLQYYRAATQRYAAIAKAAADRGDMGLAAKAALRAYANIPDGKDVKAVMNQDGSVGFQIVDDQTGKVVSQGTLQTPQQIGALAMHAAGNGFDQFILQAAGQRHAATSAGSAGAGGKPFKLRDTITAGQQIANVAMPPNVAQKNQPKVRDMATNIYETNAGDRRGGLSTRDAVAIASSLINPSSDVKLSAKSNDDGSYNVKLADGRVFRVPANTVMQAMSLLGANTKAAAKQTQEDKQRAALEAQQSAATQSALAGQRAQFSPENMPVTLQQNPALTH